MSYLIHQSFDERFSAKIAELKTKYGEEMFELDGIGSSSLDINQFAKKFFKKKVISEVSVDANANVDDDSILSFESEFTKSIQRLNAYFLIWKKMVIHPDIGLKRANKILELCINGSLKIHDLHFLLKPYCYAFSLYELVNNGLSFIKKIKIKQPNHLSSFINLTVQFTAYASNQLAGACLPGYQNIIIRDENVLKEIQIENLFKKYFNNYVNLNEWEYCDVIDKNILVKEDGKFVKVNKLARRYYKDKILNITTSSGNRLSVTKDHKFKVFINGKEAVIIANNLKITDILYVSRENDATDIITDVISKIEYSDYDDIVYELETETHWYSVGNIITHNCAFPDLFIYLDYFARKDYGNDYINTNKKEIQQELQSLVYSWCYPYRAGQSAFTNVNLYDDYFLKDLFEHTVYPDNSKIDFDSIKKLQEFYMRWFIEESKVQPLTFPINTATFYKDDNGDIKDIKFLKLISELNAFNGAFNIFTGELSSLSSCCRLRNDISKVKEYTNSFGAGGVSIGSHRVVTINLPKIAFESEDDKMYIKNLEYLVNAAHDILDVHRNILLENIERGKLPLYKYNFMNLKKQFATIGFVGMNEACELRGYDIISTDGTNFAKKILTKINNINEEKTKKDGWLRNVEQIPGESAAVSFAKKDKLLFHNHPYKLYSNQYIPLWKNVDIIDRIHAQGLFDSSVGGGSIAHLNSTDSITPDQMEQLIAYAAKTGCIYFAVNMNQCRCTVCNKLFIGKFEKSLCHNADVENFMRVVGFLVPVSSWIVERKEEYEKRQMYKKEDFNLINKK